MIFEEVHKQGPVFNNWNLRLSYADYGADTLRRENELDSVIEMLFIT